MWRGVPVAADFDKDGKLVLAALPKTLAVNDPPRRLAKQVLSA
ncbi:MAG: hypothetical protein ABIF04_07040 [Chloroflexota bacterium]